MDKYNVKNLAFVPSNFNELFVDINIPLRDDKCKIYNSGKGSLLKRNKKNWEGFKKFKVKTIKIDEVIESDEIYTSRNGKVWIDAEGISVTLARDISNNTKFNVIHFEFDCDNEQFDSLLDRDLKFLQNKHFLKCRTSHDQYNIILFHKRYLRYYCYKPLLFVLDCIPRILLYISKLIKRCFH